MVKCPSCNEPGELHLVHTYPGGWSQRKCSLCGGTNQITEEQADAIRAGARLRQDRIKRRKSLREDAVRLDVKPSVLSWAEAGSLCSEGAMLRDRLVKELDRTL